MDDEQDNIAFNAIVIVESLRSNDEKTGEILRGYIDAIGEGEESFKTTYVPISSASQFKELVAELVSKALSQNVCPILHIEAHGNENNGIYFSDDSCLSWNDLCEVITPLNRATNFKLTVVVAACFGASLISGVRLSRPGPCFAMIGPTDTVDHSDVMGVFRDFYRAVFATQDAAKAIDAMRGHTLDKGVMTVLTARNWFELLMLKYLREQTTPAAVRDFALRQYQKSVAELGTSMPMRDWKRHFRRQIPIVVRSYFETFFMLEEGHFAETSRYRSLWARIEKALPAGA